MKTLNLSDGIQVESKNSLLEKLSSNSANMLVPLSDLESMLEYEITQRCRRKVTKRLALQLAKAVLQDDHDGMFFAEKLAMRLLMRLRKEVALKEIYIERPAKR
ncbi:hypothetical protein [Roseobacter sp. OBYS 0001]|uniref:hypothetical protein n=1 Tax=Roseobacter sp. OBYS 0001 TaxID=882651 RepID=UPI001BC0D8B5|nr:hypothetical protein [Roseobacter sp. OBYS 0001]GIT86163.1 hypothetical protein ROBYS_11790 [Roseobacter sp. OBYS 0001]